MKVKDFIKLNADIDVYDDVCEELAIAFCGPAALTEEGEEHFREVLDYVIDIDFTGSIKTAVVHVDDEFFHDELWKHRFNKAYEFFYSLAGYCDADDYDKWFEDIDYGQYAINPTANMDVAVYCDTTPWFTEEEMGKDNVCYLSFPRKMVQEFYTANGGNILDFVQWYTEEYTCDDTIGLFDFCKERGFIAVRED